MNSEDMALTGKMERFLSLHVNSNLRGLVRRFLKRNRIQSRQSRQENSMVWEYINKFTGCLHILTNSLFQVSLQKKEIMFFRVFAYPINTLFSCDCN